MYVPGVKKSERRPLWHPHIPAQQAAHSTSTLSFPTSPSAPPIDCSAVDAATAPLPASLLSPSPLLYYYSDSATFLHLSPSEHLHACLGRSGPEELETEMTRRCSHCGHNGHNSRTCPDRCPDRGVRLFGVRLTTNDGTSAANMRKSVSMGNLTHYASNNNQPSTPEHSESGAAAEGYVSDGLVQTSSNARERKKGVPWTEEEHRLFLLGLQKLGKGDWRGISRNFVQSRTPTQVASHAQKYFIRQSNLNKRKRRSSLFDIVSESGPRPIVEEPLSKSPDVPAPIHQLSLSPGGLYTPGTFYEQQLPRGADMFPPMPPMAGVPLRNFPMAAHIPQAIPLPVMSLGSASLASAEQTGESASVSYAGEAVTVLPRPNPIPAGNGSLPVAGQLAMGMGGPIQFPYHLWPGIAPAYSKPIPSSPSSGSKVVKPTAQPAKIDEGSEMAKLTLGPSPSAEPSNLTLKFSGHSAFTVSKTPFNNSSVGPSTISVV
ncbi:hypothetical protein R1flu_016995 [Riccia fluitans]|uniref:Uncharacterized protein n=1 Tax=Riccia fluitans TaxID=41844 RepID=A0ABD1YPF2_9MARC